jgi:3',5'-cyclic AMP phosphodiesterase CpdA
MRLAHLSDLHLLSLEGARAGDFLNKRWMGGLNLALNRGKHYRAEVFEAAVEDLNALGIDEIVCTGDLTNLSFAAEFRFARARFDQLVRGPEHVTCIPGNHDSYVAEGVGLFETIFDAYCTSDPGFAEPGQTGYQRWPIVRLRADLAIIGLSTSRPSGWFASHGEVGSEQLERLARLLVDPRLAGKCRVVLIHHPPAGPAASKIRRGLRDHVGFADVIRKAGAELVLHGHEHLDLVSALEGPRGPVPVRGIQSGTYDAPRVDHRRARYRIYEVAGAQVIGERLRMWTGSGFVDDPGVQHAAHPAA